METLKVTFLFIVIYYHIYLIVNFAQKTCKNLQKVQIETGFEFSCQSDMLMFSQIPGNRIYFHFACLVQFNRFNINTHSYLPNLDTLNEKVFSIQTWKKESPEKEPYSNFATE